MDASSLSQALGLMACVGAFVLIALVAVVARQIIGQRGTGRLKRRPAVGPNSPAVHSPPFEDDDFGGVPTTGAVQDYERDYHPDQVIGSSGFDVQTYEYNPGDEQE